MASPTSPTDDYPGAALACAATMELPGTTINDHYDFEEYIARRGAFLGRQPQYAHYFNSCWIARKHAAEVFDHEKQRLSVQEVRRREVKTRQDPLLPLPTTSNTQSIDDYASYPDEEFSSELVEGGAGREVGGRGIADVLHAHEEAQDSVVADEELTGLTSLKARLPETPPPYVPSTQAGLSTVDSSDLTTDADDSFNAQDQDAWEERAWLDISVPDLDSDAQVEPPKDAGLQVKTALNGTDQEMAQKESVPQIFSPHHENKATAKPMSDAEETEKANREVHDQEAPQKQSNQAVSMPDRDEKFAEQPATNIGHLIQNTPVQDQPTQHQDALPKITFPEPAHRSTMQPAPTITTHTTQTATKTLPKPDNKITPSATSPTGLTFSVSAEVSALRGRGISVPVKKRGRQTPEPEDRADGTVADAEADVDADIDAASMPPPAKKARTTVPEPTKAATAIPPPAKPARVIAPPPARVTPAEVPKPWATKSVPKEPVPAVSKAIGASGFPKGVARTVKKSMANARKPAANNGASAKTRNAGHMEAIINGHTLPKTQTEAKSAAKQRYDRLLGKIPDISGRGGRRAGAAKPDLMPEFFEKANFAKGMETDSVRCICGVKDDDGGHMVGCEGCDVWQHSGCMLPGVTPDEADRMEKYYCQVCSPWERREVVQSLRRENTL